MQMSKILLKNEFDYIKSMGWIKSLRKGSTGVGYTFEQLLDLQENSLSLPDFCNIEIKTHRSFSKSFICLFNYDPQGNDSYEIKHIYDNYAYPSLRNKGIRVLNTSLYCNQMKRVGNNFFCLRIDKEEKKLYLFIFDNNGTLLEKNAFWDFHILEKKLYDKLEYLAYVTADSKFVEGSEFFRYNQIEFYKLRSFDAFLYLLEKQKIRISFKVGGNTNLDFPWQIDNHGTSFSIKSTNLKLLFFSF